MSITDIYWYNQIWNALTPFSFHDLRFRSWNPDNLIHVSPSFPGDTRHYILLAMYKLSGVGTIPCETCFVIHPLFFQATCFHDSEEIRVQLPLFYAFSSKASQDLSCTILQIYISFYRIVITNYFLVFWLSPKQVTPLLICASSVLVAPCSPTRYIEVYKYIY